MQYHKKCDGSVVDTEYCQQLRHQMEQMEFNVELFDNLPVIVYVQGMPAPELGVVSSVLFHHSREVTRNGPQR